MRGTTKTRRGYRGGEGGRNTATKEVERRRRRGKCDGEAGGCDEENNADAEPGVIHHDKGYTPRPKNNTTTSERSDDPTTTRVQRSGDQWAQRRTTSERR
jgi:hypothetical protein